MAATLSLFVSILSTQFWYDFLSSGPATAKSSSISISVVHPAMTSPFPRTRGFHSYQLDLEALSICRPETSAHLKIGHVFRPTSNFLPRRYVPGHWRTISPDNVPILLPDVTYKLFLVRPDVQIIHNGFLADISAPKPSRSNSSQA